MGLTAASGVCPERVISFRDMETWSRLFYRIRVGVVGGRPFIEMNPQFVDT